MGCRLTSQSAENRRSVVSLSCPAYPGRIHGSRGAGHHGYAVCLRCGRAASESGPASETGPPEAFQDGHSRLRGGKDPDGSSQCDGTGFAIQRGLSLGGSRITDVFELQLSGLNDATTALSLGIALRRSFCHRLGIEEEEVGVTERPSKSTDGTTQRSIFLYDAATGGNGYVGALRDHVVPVLREALKVLDCPKKCDMACHGCLLSFDTQYDSAKLDRHKAREFLTAERLDGLDLKEGDRFLGPDSRALTRPLVRHLAEVAGEPGVEEVRLWVGGDPDSWDVEDFPLYRDVLRWANDERLVRLLVAPATMKELDEGSCHSLAALVAAGRGHIEVHITPAATTDSSNGAMVAAAGGIHTHVAWATSSEGASALNVAWGLPSEGEQTVYSKIESPLPQLQTDVVPIDKLRPQPGGTVAILPIEKEFDGRIEGFGSRFWTHIHNHCSPLKEQFSKDLLTRVSYCDRYLATPWAGLLLRELLLRLVREGWADSQTALRLFTRDMRRDRRQSRDGRSIGDKWQDDAARQSFFEQAIDTGRGRLGWKGPFKFETGDAPHFRELRLEWEGGDIWTLKLDQGLGYWRCRPNADFPFDGNPPKQVLSINDTVKTRKVAAHGNHATFVYIAKE